MADSFEAELKNPAIAGLYHATKAALDFSLNKTLAEGNLSKRNTNQNFDFARGNVVRQEPQRFQANRNAANSAGLAESGVLAQTQQRQAANYEQQLTGLGQQRAQAVQRINMGESGAYEGRRVGQEQNIARANKEQNEYNIANYVAPTPSTPNTGSGSTPSGLPQVIGGKQQPSSGAPRKKAMLKYTGGYGKRPGYSNPGY